MTFQVKAIGVSNGRFSTAIIRRNVYTQTLFIMVLHLIAIQAHAVTIPAPQTSELYPDHLIVGPVGVDNQRNDPPAYDYHTATWTFAPLGSGHWDFIEVDFYCHAMSEWSNFEYIVTGGISDYTRKRRPRHRATYSFPVNTTGNVLVTHDNEVVEDTIPGDDPDSDEEEEVDTGCHNYDFHVTLFYKIPVPGIPTSINTNTPDSTGTITVSWGAASGTIHNYQLEESRNGGTYTHVYTGTLRTATLTSRIQGSSYRYRVRASAGSHGLYQYSDWRVAAPVNVPIAPPPPGSRVIYIHTDLLGSPVAESNEAGELEQ